MPNLNYERDQIQRVLDAGTTDGDFFRLKVSGNEDSKHLNVSSDQLVAIQHVLARDWHSKIRLVEETLERMGEDDRNDAIEALRSTFDEGLYSRPTS